MEGSSTSRLRIGDWTVDPDLGTLSQNGGTTRLDLRTMRLLMCLAERAGQVVSIDELINHVWAGVAVSSDSVYQAVTALRRQLRDDPRKPAYVETVPRLGYRLIAEVRACVEEPPADLVKKTDPQLSEASAAGSGGTARPLRKLIWAGVALAVLAGLGFVLYVRLSARTRSATLPAASPAASVGVLPFLDLTQGMRDEEFADGMTEEIIDKLSKIPGMQVPSATSSFYYKGKELPVAEIARGLKVNYLLDGSVRKSNGRVRIAARLMRAEDSYVIWTNTYERPLSDLIMVQDDIASEVVKALRSALGPEQTHENTH